MDIPRGGAPAIQSLSLSPLAEACSRKDLTAIHEILEKTGYKDDEGTSNEVHTFFLGVIALFVGVMQTFLCVHIIPLYSVVRKKVKQAKYLWYPRGCTARVTIVIYIFCLLIIL
jgi:hypothetical protein